MAYRKCKTLGVEQFLASRKKAMDFKEDWLAAFGRPAPVGTWIIWGNSGSGKTRFALQLAKELTNYGRVAYDSLEEGDSLSLQRGFIDVNMMEVSKKIVLLDKMEIPELLKYMKKKKSPNFVIIDSLQFASMTLKDYIELKKQLPNKLIIFISHAKGKEPKGSIAQYVRYDSDCKIRVEGFRAMVASRFSEGDTKPYVIWYKGAVDYYGIDKVDSGEI